jgi:C-terminal processing protease CtpA/Prc
LLSLTLCAGALSAQLLPEQRALDFQNLAALYAKRYAPYDWKKLAFGFDLFQIKPWLDRVQAAKDDLEFFEIEAEYVASLQDTHSSFSMTSSFTANLGITVDIYDGKVLIDSINRGLLPQASFPFAIGDELVSVDGKSVEDWITLLSKWRAYGNPVTTRRSAAGRITVRSQSVYPRAVEVGDTAAVVIRRANGNLENYTIPWTKTGVPVFKVGPVPMPHSVSTKSSAGDPASLLDEMHTWKLPDNDPLLQIIDWAVDPDGNPRKFVLGQGSRTPIFSAGFPASFVRRLGGATADFQYSGTYTSNGKTIGFIRIPGFAPANQAGAIKELDTEIDYMQKNTDGLVIDVMRNNGGGCYMLDAAARVIPFPFYFFGEEIRATQDRLDAMQSTLDFYKATRADDWIIAAYQSYVDAMKQALAADRGKTWPIPACAPYLSSWPPGMEGNLPAAVVYTKPMIVLVDEFSISAADIFPSMIQDNRRAPLVGMRTSGGGGSVSSWPTGFYSESISNNTNTLVVRKYPIVTPDLPSAPYVENIAARPDIQLNYMTRDNLLNGGKTFVDQFTSILLNLIQAGN